MKGLKKINRTGIKRVSLLLIPVFFAFIVFLLFRFVFIIGYVPSESMEPTLKTDSYIFGVRVYKNIEVGDIIIFEHDGTVMVKRVAAVSGETIGKMGRYLLFLKVRILLWGIIKITPMIQGFGKNHLFLRVI